jgi:hypothetical protein
MGGPWGHALEGDEGTPAYPVSGTSKTVRQYNSFLFVS